MANNKLKPKLKLKLLVDRGKRKVLFAEAGKDVVDFLFSILTLPVGDVVRLLTKQSMVGCLGKLYGSVESLDDAYIEANQSKSQLLTPRVASLAAFSGKAAALSWKKEDNTRPPRGIFRCDVFFKTCCGAYYSDGFGGTCPGCSRKMTTEMWYVPPPAGEKDVGTPTSSGGAGGERGFVKGGVATYTVMDDLAVEPMSAISSITLLSKCGVKDVGSQEERTVDLDMSKALELLKP